jgi:hypothetical protein
LRIRIENRPVVKPVAVLIEEVFVVSIAQADGVHAQLRQGVQFIGLGDAVVVFVNPKVSRCGNTSSLSSMIPSPFPPFSGLSNSASARKPFGFADRG